MQLVRSRSSCLSLGILRVMVNALFQDFSHIFITTKVVFIVRVVISAPSVCCAVFVANVSDAVGECECERRMRHCEGGAFGVLLLVLFLRCTCLVLYMLKM